MEKNILLEKILFGDGNDFFVDDMEFFVDRIVILPQIRPHQLEKAVKLSIEYCKLDDFRRKLLDKCNQIPVLIYQLFKRGIFLFEEIEPFLGHRNAFMMNYYFHKEINDFENFMRGKEKPYEIDRSFLENQNNIDMLIEYGFLPSSIEYCLKYDVIDDFIVFNLVNNTIKWSPFEWSVKPQYLDILSFSGFFGSIKCFKHLLLKGFQINENVLSMAVCSGCLDLYHLCQRQSVSPKQACKASEFLQLPLLVFMMENGADMNLKSEYVEFLYLMRLLFMVLLGMAI